MFPSFSVSLLFAYTLSPTTAPDRGTLTGFPVRLAVAVSYSLSH